MKRAVLALAMGLSALAAVPTFAQQIYGPSPPYAPGHTPDFRELATRISHMRQSISILQRFGSLYPQYGAQNDCDRLTADINQVETELNRMVAASEYHNLRDNYVLSLAQRIDSLNEYIEARYPHVTGPRPW